jgi:hypothetical protein
MKNGKTHKGNKLILCELCGNLSGLCGSFFSPCPEASGSFCFVARRARRVTQKYRVVNLLILRYDSLSHDFGIALLSLASPSITPSIPNRFSCGLCVWQIHQPVDEKLRCCGIRPEFH